MAKFHELDFSGSVLERGFWLYVWKVETADGHELLYVGRTGDSSSLNAQSPFNRVGQHLGENNESTNQLRTHLSAHQIDPVTCKNFHFYAYGPLLPEEDTREAHYRSRDKMAACEKMLQQALTEAGYSVLNTVSSRKQLDERLWASVRAAFAEKFPKLLK